MSKISEKLNIISSAKNDIKTAIENKGVSVGNIGIQEYANKIDEMQVATPPAKGFIINEFDSDGYATDVSIVGMTSIPDYAFASYNSNYPNLLAKKLINVNLPSDFTSLGKRAFYYCTTLESINLSNNITSIPDYAFYYCGKLALTNLPSNITSIGTSAFQNCTNLALTELPSNITSIGTSTFQNCSNLALTSLPEGITKLNSTVFYSCKNLFEITCNGLIAEIGNQAFDNCSNLAKFVLPNITKVPTLQQTSAFNNTPIKNGTGYIYVPDALVDSFKSATNWSTYANQIKGLSELPTE